MMSESELIDPELLEMLCCPACRGDLGLRAGRVRDVLRQVPVHLPRGGRHSPSLFPTDVKARFDELFQRYWDSEEKAEVYDTYVEGTESMMGMHHHVGEMRATLEVLGEPKGRLIDCGCGNGRFFDEYPTGLFTVGIDASLNLLRVVKAKGRCTRLVCCELEHIPFKDGLFDTALSVRVLQHLKEQAQGGVRDGADRRRRRRDRAPLLQPSSAPRPPPRRSA